MYQINSIVAKLETNDLDKTIEFYESVLNFKLTGRYKGNIFLSKDEQSVLFHEMLEYHGQEKPIMTGSLYLYSTNVDDIYENIKDKVKLSYPLETFDNGMREFGFFDCNGYLLVVGRSASI